MIAKNGAYTVAWICALPVENNQWQGYGALVASAYATVLLSEVPALHQGNEGLNIPTQSLWMVPFARNPRFSGREEEMAILGESISPTAELRKFAITGLGGVAIDVLRSSLIQKNFSYESSITLLEHLTFLPLAIAQATEYINENGIELSGYTSLLQQRESESLELLCEVFGDEGRYDDVLNPVGATWLVSFQQIQKQNQLAAEYLSLMACVSLTDIPPCLLPEAKSKKTHHDAIELLKPYSSITQDIENNLLSLHQLVHLSARSWLRSQGKFYSFVGLARKQLNKAFDQIPRTDQTLWRELLPHLLAVVGEQEIEMEKDTGEEYLRLLDNIGICLYNNKLDERAERIVSTAVDLRQTRHGVSNPDTLASMDTLAGLWLNQKRWSVAEQLAYTVLEERKRLLGMKNRDTLRSMNTLSVIHLGQKRYAEAEVLCKMILDIQARNLELEHRDVLRNMSNLASIYYQQKRWDEAAQIGLEAIKLRERVMGPKHPSTLTSMANLVHVYAD
ncbi:hypothetical protein BJY01DRAFT_255918 [Aspergillus pseudoustus]|uniref:Kinesin light chain n=1 Tax=Aspergillus pseudoustus TaxID=1810923 RepID=A0ABR4IG77_9EURO